MTTITTRPKGIQANYLPFLPLYEYNGRYYLHHTQISKQEYNELRSALNKKVNS